MTTAAQSLRRIVLPIQLGIDPMERLLVATFKGDPEFEGFEPQVFDDSVNGRGMRVLRYRKDGKVDVYWQPGVRVDMTTFAVGAGIGDFAEVTIEPVRFKITECGVDLHVAFTDEQGRKVELRVQEDTRGKRSFPLNWHRVWFVRYVPQSIIGTLNPPMSRPVFIELPAPGSVEVEGMKVVVDGDGSVTKISPPTVSCLRRKPITVTARKSRPTMTAYGTAHVWE